MVVSLLTREPSQEIYDEFDHYMDEEYDSKDRNLEVVLEGEVVA